MMNNNYRIRKEDLKMKTINKKANVGMSTEEKAMATLVKQAMETMATELTTAGSRAELEVQNMAALIPTDNQCVAETPKEIQAMVAEGLFAPIHGMAHITNRLGDKLFARVLIDKKGNRTIAFRQQYDDGSYSAEFTIKQDDLIIVVMCADNDNLCKDAKATQKRIIREYFRRCDRLPELNLTEVMTVLLEVLNQLPQVLDYDEEMSKQELYERVLSAVKQSSYIERRKGYFILFETVLEEVAKELGMRRKQLLSWLKREGLLYLTESCKGYQAKVPMGKNKDGSLNYDWAYCLYDLEYFARLKNPEKYGSADELVEPIPPAIELSEM